MSDDFVVRQRRGALVERPNNMERNMIAARIARVEIYREEIRWIGQFDVTLLPQLPRQCGRKRLANLDAAAR